MADGRSPSTGDRARPDWVVTALFLIGIGAAIAAFALPTSSYAAAAYVRDGLAAIAAAIVSAGAFIAFAIVRSR